MKKTIIKLVKNKHVKKAIKNKYIRKHIRKHKKFINYTWVGIATALLYVFFLWLLIDIMHIPTLISSTATVGGMFLLKYYLYKKTGFAT